MEKTGCKIICGAPTTLAVKGLMIMMMMMMMIQLKGSAVVKAAPSRPVSVCDVSLLTFGDAMNGEYLFILPRQTREFRFSPSVSKSLAVSFVRGTTQVRHAFRPRPTD